MTNPAAASQFETMRALVNRWKADSAGTYQSWFLWEERLKNFRSIRSGIAAVVSVIEEGSFGNVYKGSSLETVVGSIAEQRQIFKGADHAFLWKPKLRIPDIYENEENQRAFARFLKTCLCCSEDDGVLAAIRNLDRRGIKGLGPAAANLLYFLHPTVVPPFNTAIVNGYNRLTGAKVKLGRWDGYLAMRTGILSLNAEHRDLLSNDLGAVAGLLFDIDKRHYALPPREDDAEARAAWEADLERIRQESAEEQKAIEQRHEADRTHTDVQAWLRDLGIALGYSVWIAANDRARACGDGRLSDGCLDALPAPLENAPGADTVRLIDVLWLERLCGQVIAAFEVEHTTSIDSGILRLQDLALGGGARTVQGLFLVAPNNRENEVREKLTRPAFSRVSDLRVRYIPYGDLDAHRHSMARFGQGMKAVEAIARSLS